MAGATLACLQHPDHVPMWQDIPPFEESVAEFKAIIDSICSAAQRQTALTGTTAQKAAVREGMVASAFAVSSGMVALASLTDNAALAAQAGFSKCAIADGREANVLTRCKSILALAEQHREDLAKKANINSSDLKTLKTLVAEFESVQSAPLQARAARAAATAELASLFGRLDDLLKLRLDAMMVKFESSHPEFYAEYQSARIVMSSPAHASAPEPAPEPDAEALKAA